MRRPRSASALVLATLIPSFQFGAGEMPVGSEVVGQSTKAELEHRVEVPFELQSDAPRALAPAPERHAPLKFMMFQVPPQAQDQSVYALPTPSTTEEGANTGGINLDIKINYLTDYLYRGVDRGE